MITLTRLTAEAPMHERAGKWTIGYSIVIDSAEDMAAFAMMVRRATNLWPDAPTSIKEFSDEITNGKHMQNYRFLANEPKKEQS